MCCENHHSIDHVLIIRFKDLSGKPKPDERGANYGEECVGVKVRMNQATMTRFDVP